MCVWISVDLRMPDSEQDYSIHENYLTYNGDCIGVMQYNNLTKKVWDFQGITHWSLTPKNPDEIKKEREEYENSEYCKSLTRYVGRFLEKYAVPLEIKEPNAFIEVIDKQTEDEFCDMTRQELIDLIEYLRSDQE